MAIMYPKNIDESSVISSAEIYVYNELKEKLSDDWTVIYSAKWLSNGKVKQSQGESDFLIIHRDYVMLIVEVKGGKISATNGTWYSINRNNEKVEIADPEKEVENGKFIFLDKFKSQKANIYVTTAICFPETDLTKAFLPVNLNKEIILDVNSFDNLEENIINIFKFRMRLESFIPITKVLESDYNKVLKCILPNVNGDISLQERCKKLNLKYLTLNEEQSLCFSQLEDNNIISVNGHAGTGKTVLALHKALKDSSKNKKVLYICYNDLLRETIASESENKFDVFKIYGFAEYYLEEYNKKAYDEFQVEGDYDKMITTFINTININTSIKYDTILIDEGQDFKKEWIDSIKCLLKPDSTLCIFYDEMQMLYKKYGLTDISYLKIGAKYTLKRNMRNTDEICLSSLKLIDVSSDDVILSGIKGENPEVIYVDNNLQIEDKLKNIIRKLRKEHIDDEKITYLIMEARKKIKYKKLIRKYTNSLVESVRRFKGLENDIIIIPDVKSDFLDDELSKELLYVAMSRARCKVVLMINVDDLSRRETAELKKRVNQSFDI